jgi:hypothetical protein
MGAADDPGAADFTLPDGQAVRFDLYQMTRAEWVRFVSGKGTPEQDDALLARVAGMSVDMVQALPQPAWRGLAKALVRKAVEPLADPKSPGASSSG